MSLSEWITPALVVAVGAFLWRVLGGQIDALRTEIHRLNDGIDRHLEGHP